MAARGGHVRVDDKAWRKLRGDLLDDVKKLEVRVGVLASQGGDATVEDGSISLIELAAIHEFGSPAAGIPERSFIRLTLEGASDEIANVQAKVARAICAGKLDPQRGFDMIGAFISSEIKKTITTGPSIPPPLNPKTIERKGSSRALVDTGRLLGAITWETVRT